MGHSPEGKVVGILGMGGIGRAIRDRLKPFGFTKILYHNRKPLSSDLEGGAEYVSKEDLFKQADIICISVPLNAHTKHSINKEAISQMKDGVILINTARGAVIDEKNSLNCLNQERLEPLVLMCLKKNQKCHLNCIDCQMLSVYHTWVHTLTKLSRIWKIGSLKM